MRTNLDFAPLWRSTIGFDHLADLLVDSTLRQPHEDNYPPYNIERTSEDYYRISLAVAGFGVDDIAVTAEQNALTIEGRKPDGTAREYLYQGIAARPFRRVFNLADYVQVKQASFKDGLLIIDLVREVPEAMKPRRINIVNGASHSSQIEQKKAA
jgi:molecular chaperone IbpA